MIVMTTSNSTSVKPCFRDLRFICSSGLLSGRRAVMNPEKGKGPERPVRHLLF